MSFQYNEEEKEKEVNVNQESVLEKWDHKCVKSQKMTQKIKAWKKKKTKFWAQTTNIDQACPNSHKTKT